MYNLFGSKNKTKIIFYLTNNPSKTVKEISKQTKINYKNTFKIIQEFLEKEIVIKKENEYYIKSEFIEYIKNFSNLLLKNYTNSLFLKNKLDLYNTLVNLYPKEDIKDKIDNLIENWLVDKLDDWYSKYYDFENKEYNKVKELINNNFSNNQLRILEVGCGTGRLTKKLAEDFLKVTGIDTEEKYINFCKNKIKTNNLFFKTANIKDFKSKERYNVIIFSWIGLHYQKDITEILNNLKLLANKSSLVIILDAYYDTEYVKVLQMIRPVDMSQVKLLKGELNEKLIEKFGNFNQELLFTQYKFENIAEVINNFKIELTLEESHLWTKDDESILKEYLLNKENSTIIQEGLWISTIKISANQ